MKQSRHLFACLLFVTLQSFPAKAVVIPPVLDANYVGTYEALLYQTDEATGTPAGLITITTLGTGKLTGKLTTDENKIYSFIGGFTFDAINDRATLAAPSPITISRGTLLPALTVSLSLSNTGLTMDATVNSNGLPTRAATTGVKLTPRLKTATDTTWPGKYTLAFTPAGVVSTGPSGSSYASGTVDAAGKLTLAGKLADGTLLTAALLPDASRGYRTYLNVLKRPGSYFAGKINLVPRTVGTGFHVVTSLAPATDFVWKKPAFAADKTYPAGFGPLNLLLTMEPWTLPLKGQTLATALGTANFQFDFNLAGAGIDVSKYAGLLPKKLTISATNQLTPVYGDELAPKTPALWTPIWTGTVNPLTGIYTGSLTLKDLFDTDGAGPKQFTSILRKVTFQGVLFNVDDAQKPLAAGYFLLAPLDAKVQTIVGGSTELGNTLQTLGLGAPALNAVYPGLPGTYTLNLDTAPSDASRDVSPGFYKKLMTGLPLAGSAATISISNDLSSCSFNGKALPLLTDARSTALVYMLSSSIFTRQIITVNLDPLTGRVATFNVRYDQTLPSIVSPYTPAIAIYLNNTNLVKTK